MSQCGTLQGFIGSRVSKCYYFLLGNTQWWCSICLLIWTLHADLYVFLDVTESLQAMSVVAFVSHRLFLSLFYDWFRFMMFGSRFWDQRFYTQTQVSVNLDSGHYLQHFSYSFIIAITIKIKIQFIVVICSYNVVRLQWLTLSSSIIQDVFTHIISILYCTINLLPSGN